MRLTRNNNIVEFFVNKFEMPAELSELLKNLLKMVILIHFIGCAWGIVGILTISDDRLNWLRKIHVENKTGIVRYTSSCYWAVVTICTVGFGEISP